MDDLSGGTIRGYDLMARLGEGAYGAVYRAYQPQVGREVAIKIILPRYASQPDRTARIWPVGIEGLLKQAESLILRDPPEFTIEEKCVYLHECGVRD